MGCVRPPWFSRSKACQLQSSLTVCAAKNSGVVRLAVASHDTALAPFSQNSNELVCFGSGQAQPGQSNPSGWFIDSSDLPPLRIALSSRSAFAVACNAPQPPAGASFGWNIDLSDICGLRGD